MKSNAASPVHHHTSKSNPAKSCSARVRLTARVLLVSLFFSLLLPAFDTILPHRVLAAPGDLSPGFGLGGVVKTDFAGGNDLAQAIAATPTGRIIAAGSATIPGQGTDFALACYDEKGNLDPSFGQGGKATTDFFGANDGARGVVIDQDGNIWLSGFATNGAERQFALARYRADGSPDPGFDGDGKVVLDLGLASEAYKLGLQEDGKVVVVGEARQQNNLDFTIVRLNRDGSLDNTFGTNGVVTIDFGNADRATDLAIGKDSIFVCGIVAVSPTDADFGIVRLNLSDGSLNPAFSGDGKLTCDFFGKQDGAQGIRIFDVSDPANPTLLVTGFATNDTSDFAIVRCNFDGSLDTTFDGDGKQTVDFSGSRDLAFGSIVQPDGDAVAVGWAGIGANFDSGLFKYKADGAVGSDFGQQGKITIDTASGGNNVAFDGMIYGAKIVTAGVGLNPATGNDDFILTQHENEKFVEFTKTADPDPADQGEFITYTFTITNLTDRAIEVYIIDVLPGGVTFDSVRNPLWELKRPGNSWNAYSKKITVRSRLTETRTLVVRAAESGSHTNNASLYSTQFSNTLAVSGTFLTQASVNHFIFRARITDVRRNGNHLNVTLNSTGAPESSAIAPEAPSSAIAENASEAPGASLSAFVKNILAAPAACPVVLFDGQAQKTLRHPWHPTTVLIVRNGYRKLTPGQTVRIRVRLCGGIETDDFLYTRPRWSWVVPGN